MKRMKLFAGIELDERTRVGCESVIKRVQQSGLDARFERTEKLHVTLAFLGWVAPEQIEAISEALARAADRSAPFQMTFDKVGAFPHERRPRVIWIGARTQGAAFANLAQSVRDVYQELGFVFDKPAVAHVTIARVKGGEAHLPALDLKPLKLDVATLTLFESIPAGSTTRYEVRARYPLKRAL